MMQMIKITFLGTSGSAPTKDRGLPSVAITREGETLLFDCGEGTQIQLLRYGLNMSRIKAVFITHTHGDHIIGVAGLIRTFALNHRTEPLKIFVPKGGERSVVSLVTFDNAIINYPIIIEGVSGGVVYKGKGFSVRAFQLRHTVKTYGYSLVEDDRIHFMKEKCRAYGIKGPMFSTLLKQKRIRLNGRLIRLDEVSRRDKGVKLVYATDTRPLDTTIREARGAELLIHEASFAEPLKKLAVERKHSTAAEAAEVARRAGAKSLILFHISARYKNTNALLNEARRVFNNTSVAKDGMQIVLGAGGS